MKQARDNGKSAVNSGAKEKQKFQFDPNLLLCIPAVLLFCYGVAQRYTVLAIIALLMLPILIVPTVRDWRRRSKNQPSAPGSAKDRTTPEGSQWSEVLSHEGDGWHTQKTTFMVEEERNRCYLHYYESQVLNSHGTDIDYEESDSKDMTLREGLAKYGSQLSLEACSRLKKAADRW